MKKYNKFDTQNVIDFTLTNYGDLSSVFDMLSEAGYTSYNDFLSDKRKTLTLNGNENIVTSKYVELSNVVSTVQPNTETAILVCNGDLSVKTLIGGSFNDDFNNDFDKTNLETIVVGYEGMDLYVTFSVSNTGNANGTATGTLSLTGETSQTFTQVIEANSTFYFQFKFSNVSSGVKTLSLVGLCTQELSIEVLGSVNFVCNADGIIVESAPYYINDTVTVQWSVTNTGTANGLYEGVFTYQYGSNITIKTLSVIINAGATHTFNEEVVLSGFLISNSPILYTFTTSCGQNLQLTALLPIVGANVIYNNDLALLPLTPADGDTITVTYSMTNTGGASGQFTNYLEVYPSDSITDKSINTDILSAGETKIYSEQFIVYGCDRSIVLSGNASDSIDFTVSFNGVTKYVMWADFNAGTPTTPVYSGSYITATPGQGVFFHVYLINSTASPINTTVRQEIWFSVGGSMVLFNSVISVPSSGNCSNGVFTGAGIGSTIKGEHEVKLFLDNVYKGSLKYKII